MALNLGIGFDGLTLAFNNIENNSPNIKVVIASLDVNDVQIRKEGERRKRKNQTLSFPDSFSERYTA